MTVLPCGWILIGHKGNPVGFTMNPELAERLRLLALVGFNPWCKRVEQHEQPMRGVFRPITASGGTQAAA